MNDDLSHLRDPVSGDPLRQEQGALLSASGASYPVTEGIPRFVPAENYASDFGAQWKQFPRTQLDSFSGLSLSEDRLARCFRGELSKVSGRRVLEAGSGAGRFTEILLKHGAVLDSFDFSSAVEANAENNGTKTFNLVQADILSMPFPREAYDFVVCLGVLQHTPEPEVSIAQLWSMVAPGGRLIIDHYGWNLWKMLPPPIGDAEKAYRRVILTLPRHKRFAAVKAIVDFWFPVHWRARHSRVAQKFLRRLTGIHFYYPDIPLKSRDDHYHWALLDSHDGMTDVFKHHRSPSQIQRVFEALEAEEIHVWKGGNGVEAWARKSG